MPKNMLLYFGLNGIDSFGIGLVGEHFWAIRRISQYYLI